MSAPGHKKRKRQKWTPYSDAEIRLPENDYQKTTKRRDSTRAGRFSSQRIPFAPIGNNRDVYGGRPYDSSPCREPSSPQAGENLVFTAPMVPYFVPVPVYQGPQSPQIDPQEFQGEDLGDSHESDPDSPCTLLRRQLQYYFSIDNLCRDVYLREHMDGEGWVPLEFLLGFSRVRQIAGGDFRLLAEAVLRVAELELDTARNYVRLKTDWERWVMSKV